MGSELVQQPARYSPTGKALPLVFLAGGKHIFLASSVLSLRKNEDVHQRPSSCLPVQLPAPHTAGPANTGSGGSPPAYCGVFWGSFKTAVACIYPMLWVNLLALEGLDKAGNCLCSCRPQGTKTAVAELPSMAEALVLQGRCAAAGAGAGSRGAVGLRGQLLPREGVCWRR